MAISMDGLIRKYLKLEPYDRQFQFKGRLQVKAFESVESVPGISYEGVLNLRRNRLWLVLEV